MLENVLAREAPVSPAEVAHFIKSLEVERCRNRVAFGIFSYPSLLCTVTDRLQELSMVAWAVLAEVLEDVGEWRLWHLDLEQIVAHGNHAIVGPGLAAEGHWLLADTLVDDPVREH